MARRRQRPGAVACPRACSAGAVLFAAAAVLSAATPVPSRAGLIVRHAVAADAISAGPRESSVTIHDFGRPTPQVGSVGADPALDDLHPPFDQPLSITSHTPVAPDESRDLLRSLGHDGPGAGGIAVRPAGAGSDNRESVGHPPAAAVRTDPNAGVRTFSLVTVPEPTGAALVAAGLTTLLARRPRPARRF